MSLESLHLSEWTPEQIFQGRRWARAWQRAGKAMEKLRCEEIFILRLASYHDVVMRKGFLTSAFDRV